MREHTINERIWAKEVRLIDEDNSQLGVLQTSEALKLARERGLDLVLIAPAAKPPVARITDYGKFRYELTKKEKDSRKTSKFGIVKEVKISSKIAQHDLEVRIGKARELLEKGYKVKVSLLFRGREMTHIDLGKRVMDKMIEAVADLGKYESPPKMEGRCLGLILTPK